MRAWEKNEYIRAVQRGSPEHQPNKPTTQQEYREAISTKEKFIRERYEIYNLHLKTLKRELRRLKEDYKKFLKANPENK